MEEYSRTVEDLHLRRREFKCLEEIHQHYIIFSNESWKPMVLDCICSCVICFHMSVLKKSINITSFFLMSLGSQWCSTAFAVVSYVSIWLSTNCNLSNGHNVGRAKQRMVQRNPLVIVDEISQ